MVNWLKLLYVLVIALLYVPIVFLGANAFFPKFTGTESVFQGVQDCYVQYPPNAKMTAEEQQTIAVAQQEKTNACLATQREAEKIWNEERNVYNGWKYAAITGFNLVILVLAILLPLVDSILIGIFVGTVFTAFLATVNYWDYARTKLGFFLMLITFFVVLFIVNRQAKKLLQTKKK
jgi:hypothetical protein